MMNGLLRRRTREQLEAIAITALAVALLVCAAALALAQPPAEASLGRGGDAVPVTMAGDRITASNPPASSSRLVRPASALAVRAEREKLARLLEAKERRIAEQSLGAFTRQAWKLVEPGADLLWNWHLDAISEHLEAVSRGQIQFLIINIPPRHGKSLTVSVFWPAWDWLHNPEKRFIFTSHGLKLAIRDAVNTRTIIRSHWYQRRWADRFFLVGDQNVKSLYKNDRQGFRQSSSFKAGITGDGADRLCVDDPIDASKHDTPNALKAVNDTWDTAISSRINDPQRSAKVIMMQRVADGDLCGHVKDQHPWIWLKLPTEFVSAKRCRVFIGGELFFEDPRKEEGELLFPARFDAAYVAGRRLRPYVFAAQDQQEPAPRAGGIFLREKFKYYEPEAIGKFEEEILSLDCTFKDTAGADRVALQAWGRLGANCYLKEADAKIAGISKTLEMVEAMAARHPLASVKLVEDKANGPAVVELLQSKLSGMIEVTPEGGKIARANACEPVLNGGNLFVPNPYDAAGNPRADRAWVLEFVEELCVFNKGTYDDQVDSATQALIYFKGRESAFLRYLEMLAAQKAAAEAAAAGGARA